MPPGDFFRIISRPLDNHKPGSGKKSKNEFQGQKTGRDMENPLGKSFLFGTVVNGTITDGKRE